MWRVIIRISYFHDYQSRLRNHIATLFTAMGLNNMNTGTWESASVPLAQASVQLSQILQTLADPQAVAGVDPQAASTICGCTLTAREESDMNPSAYCIISETTEDRFDEVDSLDEAIRIARALARESQAGEPVSIEHRGRVIRQLVLLSDGRVSEEEIR